MRNNRLLPQRRAMRRLKLDGPAISGVHAQRWYICTKGLGDTGKFVEDPGGRAIDDVLS